MEGKEIKEEGIKKVTGTNNKGLYTKRPISWIKEVKWEWKDWKEEIENGDSEKVRRRKRAAGKENKNA